MFWYWIMIAIGLFVLAIACHSSVIAWIGVAAVMTAVFTFTVALPLLGYQQFIVFCIFLLLSLMVWWFMVRSLNEVNKHRNAEPYIGRIFTLQASIVNGRGLITIDGTSWILMGEDATVGAKVIVIEAYGKILKVKKYPG